MLQDRPAVATAITTFLELPFDLGLDLVHTWTYESGEPWPGWDLASMAGLIGVPAPLQPGTRPLYRLVFRRTPAHARKANEAIERAFIDWIYPDGFRERIKQRFRRRTWLRRRDWESRTVVGVTRYRHHTRADADGEADEEDGINEAVLVLNDFLMAYGLVSDDSLIGPISLTDLPSAAPVFAETGTSEGPVALRAMASVHPWIEPLLAVPRSEEEVDRSVLMFDAVHRLNEPTFPPLSLLHNAKRDLVAEQRTRAVIAAGTAVEVLIEGTLRRGWVSAGLDPARLPGALSSGFRNQLEMHLPRVIAQPVDLNDQSDAPGRWWQLGYGLRNRVVHEAYRPTGREASMAVGAAFELTAFVGRALHARPQTRALLGLLPTQRIAPTRYAFLAEDED